MTRTTSPARERAIAYDAGVKAYKAGKDRASHPFHAGTGSANAFEAGWDRAQADDHAAIPSTAAQDHVIRTHSLDKATNPTAQDEARLEELFKDAK